MKRGWIFCGGMARSGSTLQYQIVSELIERTGLGKRTSWVPPELHPSFLSKLPECGLSTFKSHILTESIKGICLKGEGIGFYIYRDIRDVIASQQLKNNLKFNEEKLKNYVLELIKLDSQWKSLPKVYITSYERLIKDFLNEIIMHAESLKIFYDLKIQYEESIFKSIYEDLSYDKQVEYLKNLDEDNFVYIDINNIYDKILLLHKNHFQGGKIGRYKEELEKWQIILIQDLAERWLIENGYELYNN